MTVVFFFLSLSKLVGELAPLPLPRKVNVGKVNASEPPKAPKRKVAPPLVPSRILNTESDNTNDLSCNNDKSSEHRGGASIAANAVSLDEDRDLVACTGPKRNSRASSSEDQTTSQQEEITSNTVENNNTTDARLRSNQSCEAENDSHANSEDSTRADAEEIDPTSRDEVSNKFIQEEEIPDAVDDHKENNEAINSNRNSNHERDIESCLNPAELNVTSTTVLNVTPEQKENSSGQSLEINSKTIDSLDECENRSDDAPIPSSNDSRKESVTNPERATELKNEQSSPLQHRRACQRPPRAPRRTAASRKKIVEENVETIERIHPRDATIKSDQEASREPCTVISTIPKCDHLDAIKENGVSNNITKQRDIVENVEPRAKQTDRDEESSRDAKIVKRMKVARSQSKSDDFETDSSTRQRRHLTSPSENIAHALNLNVPARDPISSNVTDKERKQVAGRQYSANCRTAYSAAARDEDVDKKEAGSGIITGACHCSLLTILLLKKILKWVLFYR